MPNFSGTIACFFVPVDIYFDRPNKHEVHAGTGNFEVDFNLERITGGDKTLFTFVSSIFWSFINLSNHYMLIMSLQCHSSNYFWGSIIFYFSLDPAQGQQIREK